MEDKMVDLARQLKFIEDIKQYLEAFEAAACKHIVTLEGNELIHWSTATCLVLGQMTDGIAAMADTLTDEEKEKLDEIVKRKLR